MAGSLLRPRDFIETVECLPGFSCPRKKKNRALQRFDVAGGSKFAEDGFQRSTLLDPWPLPLKVVGRNASCSSSVSSSRHSSESSSGNLRTLRNAITRAADLRASIPKPGVSFGADAEADVGQDIHFRRRDDEELATPSRWPSSAAATSLVVVIRVVRNAWGGKTSYQGVPSEEVAYNGAGRGNSTSSSPPAGTRN
jgi:hypothetical protein